MLLSQFFVAMNRTTRWQKETAGRSIYATASNASLILPDKTLPLCRDSAGCNMSSFKICWGAHLVKF